MQCKTWKISPFKCTVQCTSVDGAPFGNTCCKMPLVDALLLGILQSTVLITRIHATRHEKDLRPWNALPWAFLEALSAEEGNIFSEPRLINPRFVENVNTKPPFTATGHTQVYWAAYLPELKNKAWSRPPIAVLSPNQILPVHKHSKAGVFRPQLSYVNAQVRPDFGIKQHF